MASEPQSACPNCGAPLPPEARFCGGCGKPVPSGGGAARGAKKTMVMSAVAAPAAPAGGHAPSPSAGTPETQPAAPGPAPSTSRAAAQRTVLGMPRVEQPSAADPAPPRGASSAAGPRAAAQRTVLGMPRVEQPSAQESPSGPPASASPPSARSHRTVLGMAPVEAPVGSAPASAGPAGTDAPPASSPPPARSHRTALGMAPAQPPPSAAPGAADVGGAGGWPDEEPVALPGRSAGRSGGRLVAVLLLAVLAAAAVGGGALWWWTSRSRPLEVALLSSDEGQVLRVRLPGAPDGTRVRLGDEEATVRGEEARLPLPADSLHAGDNELQLEVTEPGGDSSRHRIVLSLRFHVRADLDPLGDWPPKLAVRVAAPKGSKVWLDDRPVPLDARGEARLALPVEPRAAGNGEELHEHAVRYRVELPDGERREGVLRTRLPLASLLLEQPGEGLVTTASRVRVAGTVDEHARVRFDTEAVDVEDGRFEAVWELQEGEAVEGGGNRHRGELLVLQAGRWPRRQRLEVLRVEDLEAHARALARRAERLDYRRLREEPRVHRGRRVAFEGYAYHVRPVAEGARGVAQVLARPCPRGERCPLWVTFPAGAQVAKGSTVLVVGRAAGMQRFRTRKGEQMEVPRVDASVVAPVADRRHRRRRRRR